MTHRSRAEFSHEELQAVLAQYDVGSVLSSEPLKKGSRKSPKAIITTDRGRFLLKRRAPGRDDAQKVAFSHTVQRYLAELDFPLPRLQRSRGKGGALLCEHGMIYELFTFLPGDGFDGTLEAAGDAGRVLAVFHKSLQGFRGAWDPPHHGYHDQNGVRTSLNGVPSTIGKNESVAGQEAALLSTVANLFEAYDKAAEKVESLGYRQWPAQIVHADWHPGNMLFIDGRVSGVIDYDSLRWLPPVTDAANGALQFSILGGANDPSSWPAEPDVPRLRRFLAGYERVSALDASQRAAVPWLMIEALIAEAVLPVAATGFFGRLEGFRFLQMVRRKADWFADHESQVIAAG